MLKGAMPQRSKAAVPALLERLKTELAIAYASTEPPRRFGYIAENADANSIARAA
jgi:hypothetical protein